MTTDDERSSVERREVDASFDAGKPVPTPTSWWAGTTADPSISRGVDGRLTLNWDADAPDHCVVHRVALVDLITEMGGLNDEIDRLKAENDAFREGGQWRTYIEALS